MSHETTLDRLRTQINDFPNRSPEYIAKQIHKLPGSTLVIREQFILERCKGKVVLDIGASGLMHEAIVKVSKFCYGIDRPVPNLSDVVALPANVVGIDLDDINASLPIYPDVELVVCGEVLEHLSNPGWFLDRLKKSYHCSIVITVPNAYSEAARLMLKTGNESVNRDHVAWHSPRTIRTLLSRSGHVIKSFAWYNGKAPTSEGMVIVAE